MQLTIDQARDIQGVGLGGFRKDHQELLFLRFTTAQAAAGLIAALSPQVASFAEVQAFNQAFSEVNRRDGVDASSIIQACWTALLISAHGYGKLGVNLQSELPAGDGATAFAAGMAARAGAIGDAGGPDDPSRWIEEFQPSAGVDALIILAADDRDDLDDAIARVGDLVSAHGCEIAFQERGGTLSGDLRGHEHFGFKDGISQPAVDGVDPAPAAGEPPAVELGELVLGYPDQQGTTAQVGDLWVDGSFVVFRRLAQQVFAFRQQTEASIAGADPQPTPSQLAAKMVGRWPSGTPLSVAPVETPPGSDPGESGVTNAFEYAGDDPSGFKTPRWAHIRKANPRDEAQPTGDQPAVRHRMLRRGIPFGPPLPPDATADDGVARGLHFLSFVADVSRQFEFVQANWLNNPNFPNGTAPVQPNNPYQPPVNEPADGPDPVVGEHADGAQDTLQQPSGAHPFALGPEVNVTAGEYFFAPSIAALGRLGSGATASSQPAAPPDAPPPPSA